MVGYASSRYFRQLSGILLAVLRPKLLGPTFYGLWTFFKVVPRYAKFIHLGARAAMRFYLPYYRQRGDNEHADQITNSVFAATGLLHVLAGMGLLLACLVQGMSHEVQFGLVCMAVYLPLEFFNRHILAVLRAEENFARISRYNYIESITVFVLTLPLLYWFRIYGVFLSVVLSRLSIDALMFFENGLRARLEFHRKPYVDMVRKGFPIMLADFCIEIIMTSDRLIIAILLSQTELGYYGIAIMVLAILIQLPGTAREIMEPQVMRDMDGRDNADFVDQYLLKPLINTAYLMPFLIGPVCLILPVGIPILLPKYLPGIIPTQIIALGVFFLALAFVPRPLIVANGWQVKIARYLALVLVVNLGLSIGLVELGYGIFGVAVGSSVSFALLFLTLFMFIAKRLSTHNQNWRRHVMGLALPFPIMCLVLFVLANSIPLWIGNSILCGAVEVALFCGIMGAVYYTASRAFPLLTLRG
jgi:O-antigen/teichoic acid export membrane protein